MRGCLSLIAILLIVVVGYGAYALLLPYKAYTGDEVFVDIPSGTSTQEIADLLAGKGVIRSRWHFMLARALSGRATLKAGEYRFAAAANVLDVLRRIARGDIFYYTLVVPEGANSFDIAKSIENLGLMKATAFVKAASAPELIRDLDPKAPSLEGYLFPATYKIPRHIKPEQVAKEMTDRFRRAWQQIGEGHTDVHGIVTMASLVEKETAVASERPVVASVYRNRLDKGMALDCDPTTIYAAIIENRYAGVIHRSDLESMNEYNTYKHAGLPPGPIANPGLSALKAAIQPAETSYLYFVAKPDGSGQHVFSSTLDEHNVAVQAYRRAHKG